MCHPGERIDFSRLKERLTTLSSWDPYLMAEATLCSQKGKECCTDIKHKILAKCVRSTPYIYLGVNICYN